MRDRDDEEGHIGELSEQLSSDAREPQWWEVLLGLRVHQYDSRVKNRIRITATEAARDFSRLLDRVSAGAEAVIERHTEPVAVLSPVDLAPRKLSECIAIRLARPSTSPDHRFAADLAEIIREASADEPPVWD
jgi:prevent-host-death family protein